MKPHFRSLPLFPAAAVLAVAGISIATPSAAHAQKAAPSPITAPAVPISIEAQAQSLNVTVAVMDQIQAVMADKTTWTPAQQKLDSHLIYAARQAQTGLQVPGRPDIKLDPDLTVTGGKVEVTLLATVSDALLNAITQAGGTVDNALPEYNHIKATLPLIQIEAIAARSDVQTISVYRAPRNRTGSVTSEGDTTHLAAAARTAFGVSGTNQVIGVLSDGDTYLAASKTKGDIKNVTVIKDANNKSQDGPAGNTGEGTAMMEIVQDIAPNASLLFATGEGGQAVFASNIRRMVDNYGATIIVDDLGYLQEGPFQDDVVAQAVNYATSKGVLYFSSAGNDGSLRAATTSVWEGDFVAGPLVTDPSGQVSGLAHKYNNSATGTYNLATAYSGFYSDIFWADPLNKSTNDYDAFATDFAGTTLRSVSTTVQNGTQNPYEYVSTPGINDRVYVLAKNGAKPRTLRIEAEGGGYGLGLAFATVGETYGHSAAAQAFSVAAAPVNYDGNTGSYVGPYPGAFTIASPVETFSSDGPRQIFYNPDGSAVTPGNVLVSTGGGVVRQKPDITAADGVSTSIAYFTPFYGTSAAAPHAAAIAGLVKSMNGMAGSTLIKGQLLSYNELYATLTGSALDTGVAGVDVNAGYGIVMPQAALNFLKNLATNVVVSNIRNNTATVTWRTNLPASSSFVYAPGTSTGGKTFTDPTFTTTHSVTLSGLLSGTKYAFTIGAATQTGSVVYQAPVDQYFTTTGLGPTTTLAFDTKASAVKSGNEVIVTVNIINTGTGIANTITLTSATLNGVVAKTGMPVVVGSGLYPGATLPAPVRFVYPATTPAGTTMTVAVTGILANGPGTAYSYSGTATVKLP